MCGESESSVVAKGDLDKSCLDRNDVFIVDTGKELFVWIGRDASPDENRNAMPYAHVRMTACEWPGGLLISLDFRTI